jgi:hypothetical protein
VLRTECGAELLAVWTSLMPDSSKRLLLCAFGLITATEPGLGLAAELTEDTCIEVGGGEPSRSKVLFPAAVERDNPKTLTCEGSAGALTDPLSPESGLPNRFMFPSAPIKLAGVAIS